MKHLAMTSIILLSSCSGPAGFPRVIGYNILPNGAACKVTALDMFRTNEQCGQPPFVPPQPVITPPVLEASQDMPPEPISQVEQPQRPIQETNTVQGIPQQLQMPPTQLHPPKYPNNQIPSSDTYDTRLVPPPGGGLSEYKPEGNSPHYQTPNYYAPAQSNTTVETRQIDNVSDDQDRLRQRLDTQQDRLREQLKERLKLQQPKTVETPTPAINQHSEPPQLLERTQPSKTVQPVQKPPVTNNQTVITQVPLNKPDVDTTVRLRPNSANGPSY